jgi:hypothetical protein
MNTLELIRTVNRRTNREDRRKCDDRRQRYTGNPDRDAMVRTLQELLREAHARIRTLENAVEALKKAI